LGEFGNITEASFMYGDYLVPEEDLLGRLIRAIEFGDCEEFLELVPIQENINENDSDFDEWTPLMYAIQENSFKMVKVLVEAGADVNLGGVESDEFPLNWAAYGCCSASYGYVYTRYKKIYDYLFPLTSPGLQQIAENNFNSRTNTIFN